MKNLATKLGLRSSLRGLCLALGGLLACGTAALSQTVVSRTPDSLIMRGNPNAPVSAPVGASPIVPPGFQRAPGYDPETVGLDRQRRSSIYQGMPVDQAEKAYEAGMKAHAQRGYQRDLANGVSGAEALVKWGPQMFCDNPPALVAALALAKAAEPAPKRSVTPRAPETGEGKLVMGTGFFVTDDGYLVTCEHVVAKGTSFRVRSALSSRPAHLIASDRAIDIALLKVDAVFQSIALAREPHIKLGDAVLTIGFPNPDLQGVKPKLTRGEISSMAGIQDDPRFFQISVPVQPGNSGGALVDECGNVVGVVTSRLDDAATYESSGALPQNVNYAVKGSLVRDFLQKVPELAGKLKASSTAKDREAASVAAERAAVLIIAE